LPGYSHGLGPLLGKIAPVEDPDRQRVYQPGTKILLQAVDNCDIVPARLGEKALEGSGRHRDHLGQILGVAALLGLDQQGLEIMPAVLSPLLAAEGWGEEDVEVTEGLLHPIQLFRIHPTPPRAFTTLKQYPTISTRRCNTRRLSE
jgi:hypothetical protein